jgi:(5-formylfuran-3-yl)methyl phosphate synthase
MDLLVSVRSAAEALSALDGWAALIDIKEPARGSLGRADVVGMRAVIEAVAGRRPVSAALGEWAEDQEPIPDLPLAYVKWGLAGCVRKPDWRPSFGRLLGKSQRPQVVLVAYADWECAQAPSPDEVFAVAKEHPGCVMLVDTHCKEANNLIRKVRPTLLDWLAREWLVDWCGRCRDAGVKIALAGSLGVFEIQALVPARPDWFAVRGAVCADGDRHGLVQVEKVRQLVGLLHKESPK